MANPWFKFYPTDWRADPALRMCSPAARGVWIDMICLMHEASPYGYLLVNGHCPTDAQVAVLVGLPPEQFSDLLGELEAAGIFSRTRDGVIYSRKMTRASKKAAIAQKNGRKGGNPNLSKEKGNSASVNQKPKDRVKPQKPEARNQKPDKRISEPNGSSVISSENSLDLPKQEPDKIQLAFDAYNTLAEYRGLPVAQKLTDARKRGLRSRLSDAGGIEGWVEAMRKASKAPHLIGDNERGWRADLDFFLQAKSFNRLIEGFYDRKQSGGSSSAALARLQGDTPEPGEVPQIENTKEVGYDG